MVLLLTKAIEGLVQLNSASTLRNSFFGLCTRWIQTKILKQIFQLDSNVTRGSSFFFFLFSQHLTSLRVCPHCVWRGKTPQPVSAGWESADSRWLLRRAALQRRSAKWERWQEVGSKELADTNTQTTANGKQRNCALTARRCGRRTWKCLLSGLPPCSTSSCSLQIRFHSRRWWRRLEASQPRSAHAESDWTNKLTPETWSDTLKQRRRWRQRGLRRATLTCALCAAAEEKR